MPEHKQRVVLTIAHSGRSDEVVGGADRSPFGTHALNAQRQELSEASGLLDLSEHRFHHLFSPSIPASPMAIPWGAGAYSAAISAWCHLRTLALQQIAASFKYLTNTDGQRRQHNEAACSGHWRLMPKDSFNDK